MFSGGLCGFGDLQALRVEKASLPWGSLVGSHTKNISRSSSNHWVFLLLRKCATILLFPGFALRLSPARASVLGLRPGTASWACAPRCLPVSREIVQPALSLRIPPCVHVLQGFGFQTRQPQPGTPLGIVTDRESGDRRPSCRPKASFRVQI